jgi:predicted phosphodiesterase
VSGRTWTEAELEALQAGISFTEFDRYFPGRTYDAWRLKRSAVGVARPVRDSHVTVTVAPEAEPEDVEAFYQKLEAVQDARAALSRHQESTTVRIDDDRPIAVAFLGDVHVGAGGVDYRQLRTDLETIAATDGLYVIGMGDYLENVKPQSKAGSALYSGLFNSPDEQLGYWVTRAEIARGSWLAVLQGNHDAWDGRWSGVDRLPSLAKRLGCAYFTEMGGTILVEHGGQRYVIVARHNHRGNSAINKTNPQRRLFDEWPWEWENADVVCLAHTHEPILEQVQRKGRTVTYLRSGTYKTRDDWAERNGYRPGYGVPVVVLWPGERRVVAFHGEHFDEAVRYLKGVRGA